VKTPGGHRATSSYQAKADMADLFREEKARPAGLLTVEEAAAKTGRSIETISDYVRRGRLAAYDPYGLKTDDTNPLRSFVKEKELTHFLSVVEQDIKRYQSEGLNPELGFYDVPEWERTKHVHRLHPYLGKFIPQLVEYFLSRHFEPGQWVLDPFMGSGTTLVQANEMGLHAVGVDISEFNCKVVEVKTRKYEVLVVEAEVLDALRRVAAFSEERLGNSGQRGLFDHDLEELRTDSEYLNTWFAPRALQEILHYRSVISEYEHEDILKIILSRASRSARLIPHYDLATPKEPVREPYYCFKHKRTCEPIGECLKFLRRYSLDTIARLKEFDGLRSGREIRILHADSRDSELDAQVDGIMTSPPYVGAIDYHDQHTYAYELFGFERRDEQEIGAKSAGRSRAAQEDYTDGIAAVIRNMKRYVRPEGPMFFVANDRLGLYPAIAERAGCRIVEVQARAVSKRTERDKKPYSESIFQLVDAE